ncbi:hypothetical protein MOQ_004946 [Trypanosoma cruzi marinkellei]|uniref:Uncharacterized protein n=1 Tax=Trypanosoma cruzi marinkellei TaxID=85056 RepID=K2NQP8_TRYCR|nr:hypothetical protein MOQ_004946 [Trypanosoma cruzi marinkellei]
MRWEDFSGAASETSIQKQSTILTFQKVCTVYPHHCPAAQAMAAISSSSSGVRAHAVATSLLFDLLTSWPQWRHLLLPCLEMLDWFGKRLVVFALFQIHRSSQILFMLPDLDWFRVVFPLGMSPLHEAVLIMVSQSQLSLNRPAAPTPASFPKEFTAPDPSDASCTPSALSTGRSNVQMPEMPSSPHSAAEGPESGLCSLFHFL